MGNYSTKLGIKRDIDCNTWDYEGYWNVVMGPQRSAVDVVDEFGLDITDSQGLDGWLGEAESAAALAGGIEVPASWAELHVRALAELRASATSG